MNISELYLNHTYEYEKISDIVKDPEWQELRKSLVGTWKISPEDNVNKLRNYLGSRPWKNINKMRIVRNYISGTAFRLGKIQNIEINKLKEDIKNDLELLKNDK